LSYMPENDRALEITGLVSRLESAHEGMNNFYNEPPIARELRKYIGEDGGIPQQINDEYVRVLSRCRIGRTSGVSNAAVPLYDALFDLFGAPQTRAFVKVLDNAEVAGRLDNAGCAERFREIAT